MTAVMGDKQTAAKEQLWQIPAGELAARVARGESSALEVVEAHIARIEAVNPALNAMVAPRFDAARQEAQKADARQAAGEQLGPLHGVPITVKECLDLTGTASTFGIPSRATERATVDDRYVARLRQAGAIVLGKSNVAQLLLFIETENPLYGRTNNPWNLDRSPGGSSGGEAALIAAGGSPLGLGTDIGGSVRVPATFCGIASIKPTSGRLPDAGRFSVPFGQQAIVSQVGVLGRTVADVALGLTVANGGPNPNVEPPMPLGDPASVDIAALRVAFYTDDGIFPVAPAVKRAVEEAAAALAARGAQVTRWAPPDPARALDLFLGILSADSFQGMKRALGKDRRDRRIAAIERAASAPSPVLKVVLALMRRTGRARLARIGRNYGHRDTDHYWRLVEALADYRTRVATAMETASGGPFDVILSPACALPAFRHGAAEELVLAGAYTCLYNVLGYPAGVTPFTRVRPGEEVGRIPSKDKMEQTAYQTEQGSAGLPVGVQVVGRPWREHVALAAMSALEDAARTRGELPGIAPIG